MDGNDIDLERLLKLGAFSDPAVKGMIDRFFAGLDERIRHIAESFEKRSETELRQQLHQLRGSAGSCGFPALADVCRQGEASPGDFDVRLLKEAAVRAQMAWES